MPVGIVKSIQAFITRKRNMDHNFDSKSMLSCSLDNSHGISTLASEHTPLAQVNVPAALLPEGSLGCPVSDLCREGQRHVPRG